MKSLSILASTSAGVVSRLTAMALIGVPEATASSKCCSSVVRSPSRCTEPGQRGHDRGIEHRTTRGHLPDGPHQLVAFCDPVFEKVRVTGGAL